MVDLVKPPALAGIGRRPLGKGLLAAAGVGLAYGTGVAPAIGQGRRDLRVGVFGGDFGNLSPLIRYDIQGGLIMYNLLDPLVAIDFTTRKIVPLVAEAWSNPDPRPGGSRSARGLSGRRATVS